MKTTLLLIGLLFFASGCSDSVSTQTYPLLLAELQPASKPGSVGFYSLKLTQDGKVVKGAKLAITLYPSDSVDTIRVPNSTNPLLSDTAGVFLFSYDWKTSTSIAFQGVKDSLKSNFIKY